MLEFCDRALAYTDGVSRESLLADRMRYDAVLRNLELIGEAATHVDDVHKVLAPQIPWRQIVATRNRVAHGYLGIAADTVWDILRTDLPALRLALVDLLNNMTQPPAA